MKSPFFGPSVLGIVFFCLALTTTSWGQEPWGRRAQELVRQDSLDAVVSMLTDESRNMDDRVRIVQSLEALSCPDTLAAPCRRRVAIVLYKLLDQAPTPGFETGPKTTIVLFDHGSPSSVLQSPPSRGFYYECPVREAAAAVMWKTWPTHAVFLEDAAYKACKSPGARKYDEYLEEILTNSAVRAKPQLVGMVMNDPVMECRVAAGMALSHVVGMDLSDPDAPVVVPALIGMLADESNEFRSQIVLSLEGITGERLPADYASWFAWWLAKRR